MYCWGSYCLAEGGMTEDLTVEEQLQRYQEALNDPLEFFKYVKILDSTINDIIPAQMWPHLVWVSGLLPQEEHI